MFTLHTTTLCLVVGHLKKVCINFPVALSLTAEAKLVVTAVSAYSCKESNDNLLKFKRLNEG